jgi:hypothetical protein
VLTYEDFSTFLAQEEAILNSRHLSALSDDSQTISAGHFGNQDILFVLLLSPRFQIQLSLICQTHDFFTFKESMQDSKHFATDGPQNVCKLTNQSQSGKTLTTTLSKAH